jgi:hypothetical protein
MHLDQYSHAREEESNARISRSAKPAEPHRREREIPSALTSSREADTRPWPIRGRLILASPEAKKRVDHGLTSNV